MSNTTVPTGYAYEGTGNMPFHAVAEGGQFFCRGPGAGAVSHSRNVYCLYVAMRCCNRSDAEQLAHKAEWADDVHMWLYGGDAHDLKSLVEEILEHKQWASSFESRYRDFASFVEQRCCKYSSCKYKYKYNHKAN